MCDNNASLYMCLEGMRSSYLSGKNISCIGEVVDFIENIPTHILATKFDPEWHNRKGCIWFPKFTPGKKFLYLVILQKNFKANQLQIKYFIFMWMN